MSFCAHSLGGSRLLRSFLCAVVICLGVVQSAGAQVVGEPEFEAGLTYYKAGDYTNALRAFQAAYELSSRPELLYNMARCHEGLGDAKRAVHFLDRYLSEAAKIPNRAKVERYRMVLVERALIAHAPDPGQSQDNGETTATGRRLPVSSVALFSTAGAGVAMAATFGALALAERNRVSDGCGQIKSCSRNQVQKMDRFAIISDVGLGVAIASTAVGLGLFFRHRRKQRANEQRLGGWFDHKSAGLLLKGTF